ncbi:hypothetical protein D3C71_2177330 [compost metagenome]
MLAQVGQGGADAGEMPLLLDQRPQHPSLRAAQGGIEHFAHPRRAQHLGIQRVLQAAQ